MEDPCGQGSSEWFHPPWGLLPMPHFLQHEVLRPITVVSNTVYSKVAHIIALCKSVLALNTLHRKVARSFGRRNRKLMACGWCRYVVCTFVHTNFVEQCEQQNCVQSNSNIDVWMQIRLSSFQIMFNAKLHKNVPLNVGKNKNSQILRRVQQRTAHMHGLASLN